MIFSKRPLQIDEIVDAVAVGPKGERHFNPRNRMPEPREISRYCSSLVIVVSTQNNSDDANDAEAVLQLAHFSVKEYLTSSRVQTEFRQVFQENTAKVAIATVCLGYLLHLDQNLKWQDMELTFPFARYCALNWMEHAAVSNEQDEELRCLALELFLHEKSYINWLNLNNNLHVLRGLEPTFENQPAALYCASFGGLTHVVGDLIRQGANINAQGGFYGNALQAASVNGHDKVVELLLDKGADINAQGGYYGNALQAASVAGHDKIVDLLLDKDADINVQGGFYGNALQAASVAGHDNIVKMLLDKDADIDASGVYFDNALQAASARGHDKIVALLLDKGDDINPHEGHYGKAQALQTASAYGHDKIVELLLSYGAGKSTYVCHPDLSSGITTYGFQRDGEDDQVFGNFIDTIDWGHIPRA
jgi:ankyrin repeat protein